MTQTKTNWGEAIQTQYLRFLKIGHLPEWSGWKLYTSEMYDQLVEDSFIEKDYHLMLLDQARSSLKGELEKKIAMRRIFIDTHAQTQEDIQQANSHIIAHQNEQKLYDQGRYETRIELRAKQWAVQRLFEDARTQKVIHIYKPEEQ